MGMRVLCVCHLYRHFHVALAVWSQQARGIDVDEFPVKEFTQKRRVTNSKGVFLKKKKLL